MHSIERIKQMNARTELNDDEQEKYDSLVAAGFTVETAYSSLDDDFLFYTRTPEGKGISPMNSREVFWMLEGYKAGKAAQ